MVAAVDTDLFSKPSLDFASFCFSLVNTRNKILTAIFQVP